MKKLYIRFFSDKDSSFCTQYEIRPNDNFQKDIDLWMKRYPDGKVDYINL